MQMTGSSLQNYVVQERGYFMIRIITDSTSDITMDQAAKLNIEVMPLTVSFGEKSYRSGIDITNEEFYKKIVSCSELPKTAQVNPYEFEEKYKGFLDAGDEIISIHLSKGLSGTYQSAQIAKDTLNSDKITVIDSLNVASALGLLVIIAAQMRDQGASVKEITEAINSYIPRLRLYIVLDTLDYLKKGGRISPTVAFIGGVLNLHPIVTMSNGKVEIADKAKGKKSAIKWLRDKMQALAQEDELPMLVGHADAVSRGIALKEALEEDGVKNIIDNVCMGSVVGSYSGPDAIGIYYISKE